MIIASPPPEDRSCALGARRRLARRACCAVVLALLLAAPALAAGTHPERCETAHGRRSRACTQARHTHASPTHRARTHRKTARPHRHVRPRSHPVTLHSPPSCEDGSSAVKAGGGLLHCADGSEPACEPPSVPTLSPAGTPRFCTVPATASHFGEASCEAGRECLDAEGLPEAPCEGEGEGAPAASGEEEACTDGSPS